MFLHSREVLRLVIKNNENNKKTDIDILKATKIINIVSGNVCPYTITIYFKKDGFRNRDEI